MQRAAPACRGHLSRRVTIAHGLGVMPSAPISALAAGFSCSRPVLAHSPLTSRYVTTSHVRGLARSPAHLSLGRAPALPELGAPFPSNHCSSISK